MSIRKQARKSREIGMLTSAPQTQCVTPPTSVSFCTGREVAQIAEGASGRNYHFMQDGGALGTARPTRNTPGRARCPQRAARRACQPRPPGFEWIFAGASTAKVMLNRGMTAVPEYWDWIESAWLTKRRQTLARLNVTQEV